MLLAMDVGNSNIKVGLFEEEKLISSFRITTNADRSSDEYGLLIIHFLSYLNRTADEIEGVFACIKSPLIRVIFKHQLVDTVHDAHLFPVPSDVRFLSAEFGHQAAI